MTNKPKYDLEMENPYVTFRKPQLNPFTVKIMNTLKEEGHVKVEDVRGRIHDITWLVMDNDDTCLPYFADGVGEHSWELNGKSYKNSSHDLKKFYIE